QRQSNHSMNWISITNIADDLKQNWRKKASKLHAMSISCGRLWIERIGPSKYLFVRRSVIAMNWDFCSPKSTSNWKNTPSQNNGSIGDLPLASKFITPRPFPASPKSDEPQSDLGDTLRVRKQGAR